MINQLQSESFDVLVIGGGITGTGIALDAAARGLRTALIEKNDFAFGTSSRSTKLIHGGLRYLKQLEFALVKEVGSERAIVHKLAPHLVVPEKMLLPLYEKRGLGYWLTSIGLKIYDWLAGVKTEDRRKMLTKFQTLRYEPLLKKEDVRGGAIYAEYRTDDARLTIEVAKEAFAKGACLLNYVQCTDFIYESERIIGAKVKDVLKNRAFEIKSSVIINATGPWVDDLRKMDKSKTGKHLHLTKGVHLVVPYHRLPVRQAIYFDVPDGRMIFTIPRGRVTYVGTTDTDYYDGKEQVVASKEDVLYLVDAVNATFPSIHLTVADIESSWAGLRPLIYEEGKSASELSRKDEIFVSSTNLISIAGGKLTGYRKMSERVVDLIIEQNFNGRNFNSCATDKISLGRSGFKNSEEVKYFQQKIASRMVNLGLKGEEAFNLVHLFGKQSEIILNYLTVHDVQNVEEELILAQLKYCMENELVVKAEDFLVRRTGLLFFNLPKLVKVLDIVLQLMAHYLNWDGERLNKERTSMKEIIQQTLSFKN